MSGVGPDVNVGPSILIANWTEASIAIIFVVLRIYTQINIVRKVHPEDYFIVAALLFQLVNTSILTAAIHYGVGRHMQYLTFEQRVSAMRLEFLSQAFGLAGAAFARISFAVLLLKFCVASRAWCWTVWSIIWVQAVCNSATVLIIYLQCRPIQALWNPNVEGTCWSPQIQVIAGYALGVINAVNDILLLLLPVYIIRSLTLQLRVKAVLSTVMCTSVFAFVASIVKTVELRTLGDRQDFTYQTSKFIIWLTIETYMRICAASVPAFRLLILSFTKRSSRHDHHMPSVSPLSPPCDHAHPPPGSSRRDSLFSPDNLMTVITMPQAFREGPERDLEKDVTTYVETSHAGSKTNMEYYAAREAQQGWNPGIAVMDTTEINIPYEESSTAKPKYKQTPV